MSTHPRRWEWDPIFETIGLQSLALLALQEGAMAR